jgi:hypothetical protein
MLYRISLSPNLLVNEWKTSMVAHARKRLVSAFLAAFLALQSLSCGTLLYPERRGQPPGPLDVGVVALDAVGLLLFFVPGIVAFAVDFATGTIYLPPGQPYCSAAAAGRPWQTFQVDPSELTPRRLEVIVGDQTGQPIRLEPGTYQAAKLPSIQGFTDAALRDLQSAPAPTRVIFRGSSE